MSDYTKSTDFASKDALPSGNAAKIVKGTEIDTEFNNIAVAISTKADLASPGFSGSPTAPTQSSGDNTAKLATTGFVTAAVAAALTTAIYPVGSIYTNATVSTNPATLLGFGTWTAFGTGRVLIGVDSGNAAFDTLGETGGTADAIVVSHTHTGTTDTVGNHQHTIPSVNSGAVGGNGTPVSSNTNGNLTISSGSAGSHNHSFTTDSSGASGTNANLPPYYALAYIMKA